MVRPTLSEITYLPSYCNPRPSVFHEDIKSEVLDDHVAVFYYIEPPHDDADIGTDVAKVGFTFVAFEWCGCPADKVDQASPGKSYWGPETEVEVFAYGEARFDGVRHLWFGHEKTDNAGYHYYPRLDSLAKLAEWLQKMEKEHCWDI